MEFNGMPMCETCPYMNQFYGCTYPYCNDYNMPPFEFYRDNENANVNKPVIHENVNVNKPIIPANPIMKENVKVPENKMEEKGKNYINYDEFKSLEQNVNTVEINNTLIKIEQEHPGIFKKLLMLGIAYEECKKILYLTLLCSGKFTKEVPIKVVKENMPKVKENLVNKGKY